MAGVSPNGEAEPFAEQLRRLRLAAGLTQESLAQAAGISVDAVGTLERGTRLTPRADTARLLADALNLDGADREQFLSGSAPHPRDHPPRRVNASLPQPMTALVGRTELVAQVCRLVTNGQARLITLTGPGGVGKTRVALAAAAELADTLGWVDLARLRDPADVPYAIAAAIGLDCDPGRPPDTALHHWAATGHGLLVLDNCDHLLDAVADLATDPFAGPAGVRLLTTSRERIGVPGEYVVVVPPLRLPAPGQLDPDNESVRLFADRAAQASPGFPLEPVLERVSDICRALDGLPLAIELAAARVGTLTVDDLADRLSARLDLLGAQRGVDRRHHTLRAVVDWSYELLTAPEQLLFARLHAFAGAFDLAAAEAVTADERLPVPRIPDLVASLTDRSLLTRPGHASAGRYRMLETIRWYARDQLPPEDRARMLHAHADYIAALAEHASVALAVPDEAARAARVEAWLDDARTAFAWARDTDHVALAMRLIAGLARYAWWRMRPDVLAWGEWAIRTVPEHPQLPVAYSAAAAGQWLAGRPHESRALARRAIHSAGGPTALAAAVPPELAIVCVSLAANAALALYQLPSLPEEHSAQAGHDRAKTLPVYRQLTDLTAAGTLGKGQVPRVVRPPSSRQNTYPPSW